jgi:hypothetical protein
VVLVAQVLLVKETLAAIVMAQITHNLKVAAEELVLLVMMVLPQMVMVMVTEELD